jgi:DNA-binding NarL/FixJ family response regulator
VVPRLWTLRGKSLSGLGEHGKAAADLQAAVVAARTHGARTLLWRAQAELARVSRRLRRRADAEVTEGAARDTIQELADAIADGDLRASFLQAALAQLPQPPPSTPNQAAKQQFDGLTERERQVAALLRRGLSNRAAADELVVSERTFERHVANIMAKLGVSSRSQIAVWAAEKGLPRSAD